MKIKETEQQTNKITAENMLNKTKESILIEAEELIKVAATNGLYEVVVNYDRNLLSILKERGFRVFTDDDGSVLRVGWGE